MLAVCLLTSAYVQQYPTDLGAQVGADKTPIVKCAPTYAAHKLVNPQVRVQRLS